MHRNRRARLSDEDVAAILDGSALPGRAGRGLLEAAEAIGPRIAPREGYRDHLKDVILREHDRLSTLPSGGGSGSLGVDKSVEHAPPMGHKPVALIVDGVRVDMADIDPIDARTSVEAARLIVQLAGYATDRNQ